MRIRGQGWYMWGALVLALGPGAANRVKISFPLVGN
jgi:hypothetical protein